MNEVDQNFAQVRCIDSTNGAKSIYVRPRWGGTYKGIEGLHVKRGAYF